MNTEKKLQFIILVLIISIISNASYAQKLSDKKGEQLNYLTVQQKQLLKDQQALIDKTKSIFKENLTKEQLATLNNRSISKQQRIKLLKQSLSLKQRDIISSNRAVLKKNRMAFRNSLTRKQKFRLRRFITDRKIDDRRRLVRRLRRLVRDNIDQ
jgi:ABC-type phosphate transport system substrate-binding protein